MAKKAKATGQKILEQTVEKSQEQEPRSATEFKLYEIAGELEKALVNAMDPETGEYCKEMTDILDKLEMEKGAKVINCGKYYKSLIAMTNAYKDEIDSLNKKRKVVANKAERLKEYIDYYAKGEAYTDPAVSIDWRKSTQVVIENADLLPDDCVTYEPKVDKKIVKEMLQKGDSVDGARMQVNYNLQIK